MSGGSGNTGGIVGIIGTIIFGLIVGFVAKLLMPGKDPGGVIITILLGIVGSVLGRWLGQALGFYGPDEAAGFLMSLVGAVVLLAILGLGVQGAPLTPGARQSLGMALLFVGVVMPLLMAIAESMPTAQLLASTRPDGKVELLVYASAGQR